MKLNKNNIKEQKQKNKKIPYQKPTIKVEKIITTFFRKPDYIDELNNYNMLAMTESDTSDGY